MDKSNSIIVSEYLIILCESYMPKFLCNLRNYGLRNSDASGVYFITLLGSGAVENSSAVLALLLGRDEFHTTTY